MVSPLQTEDWEILLRRIEIGKCTPFLGAGACFGALPLGSEIAEEWASKYQYPLDNSDNLANVAQFLAVRYDPMFPKEEIIKRLNGDCLPNFNDPDEPHSLLATLPLPAYLTTNYDNFMVQALKNKHKNPFRELCRWNRYVKDQPSKLDFESDYTPTPFNPVVYHLHGHNEVPESLVLTEDDYLDFLVNISKDHTLLPHYIQRALAGTSLLFIGYSLTDMSFRVLFRGLVTATEKSLRRISITIQLPPVTGKGNATIKQEYLDQYFNQLDMRVFWGTAKEFSKELRHRWRQYSSVD